MEAPPPAQRTRALALLILGVFFAALGFPMTKIIVLLHERLLPGSSGWFITAGVAGPRFMLPIPVLLWWHFRQRHGGRITRKEFKQGLVLGLLATVGMIALSDGLRFIAASTSAFFVTLYAIMIPIWLALRHWRAPGPVVWISCAMVLTGVTILGHFNWHELKMGRGELETLAGAVFFAAQILCLDSKAFAGNRPASVTLVMFVSMSAILGAFLLATMPDPSALRVLGTSPAWLGLTFVLAIAATLVPLAITNAWQPKITATEAGIIYTLEPILSSLFALFLPACLARWTATDYSNETATLSLLIGGGLITLANILIQLLPPVPHSAAETKI